MAPERWMVQRALENRQDQAVCPAIAPVDCNNGQCCPPGSFCMQLRAGLSGCVISNNQGQTLTLTALPRTTSPGVAPPSTTTTTSSQTEPTSGTTSATPPSFVTSLPTVSSSTSLTEPAGSSFITSLPTLTTLISSPEASTIISGPTTGTLSSTMSPDSTSSSKSHSHVSTRCVHSKQFRSSLFVRTELFVQLVRRGGRRTAARTHSHLVRYG